jgi:hypothetical protein
VDWWETLKSSVGAPYKGWNDVDDRHRDRDRGVVLSSCACRYFRPS